MRKEEEIREEIKKLKDKKKEILYEPVHGDHYSLQLKRDVLDSYNFQIKVLNWVLDEK